MQPKQKKLIQIYTEVPNPRGRLMYKVVSFTTLELFDKVWTTPVLKLAQEIGVSDVGLAKACRKAGIPLPSRGYWAKQAVKRPAKPKPPTDNTVISFKVLDRTLLPAEKAVGGKNEPANAPPIVPPILKDPHPLVAKWLKHAESATTHEGHLAIQKMHVLDTRISAAQVDRAALILDTLIKASEALDYLWTTGAQDKTTIQIEGEKFTLQLKERLIKLALPPPPPIPRKRGAPWTPDFSSWRAPQFEWIPTGELSLQVEADTMHGTRKNWADTKTKTLEQRLGGVIEGLPLIAESIKSARVRREEQQRARRIEEELRLEQVRQDESQRRLRQELISNTERWLLSVQLRAFIEATCKANAGSPAHVREQTALWAKWATDQADELDPIQANMGSVINLTATVESWFTGHSMRRGEKDWWLE
ncbi:MAG TPA: hypothetical protein VF682_14360 [Pseudomonas sp.]